MAYIAIPEELRGLILKFIDETSITGLNRVELAATISIELKRSKVVRETETKDVKIHSNK